MEHRHEKRFTCRISIELYRKDEYIGIAEVNDVSKNGLSIHTSVALHNNELIHVKFTEEAALHGWPIDAPAMVTHTEYDSVGLLFDGAIFIDLPALQKACDENTGLRCLGVNVAPAHP